MTRRRGPRRVLETISWRDIPAEVVVRDGEQTHKAVLPPRFQRAIDRAARVAGLTELPDYLAQWRRDSRPLEGTAAATLAQEAERLDRAYPRERLAELVRHGGLAPAGAEIDVADGGGGPPSDGDRVVADAPDPVGGPDGRGLSGGDR